MAFQKGFFSWQFRFEQLEDAGDPLVALANAVDWEIFRPIIEKHRPDKPKGTPGRPQYDAVLMFKVLVLKSLYGLSHAQTEFQIRDRLSFMRFLGLTLDDPAPDANTIWNFEKLMADAEADRVLFDRLERHLSECGLVARKGQIVDASIVSCPKQRNSHEENDQIKRGETPEGWSPKKTVQKDTDARWTQKNDVNYFGYKNHVAIDAEHKLIRNYETTDASVHDSQVFEELLDEENTNRDVYADSAYISKESIEHLKERGFRPKINRKGTRNHPLSDREKQGNRTRSKTRCRIEHVFGTQSQLARGQTLIRAIGRVKASFQIGMRNLVYNLHRGAYLLAKA